MQASGQALWPHPLVKWAGPPGLFEEIEFEQDTVAFLYEKLAQPD